MTPFRLATAWLSGCSGCHMSLLNLHEGLLELLTHCELVYSPLMDLKSYPEAVDIVLVEGAVGTEDNLETARVIRQRSRIVISLGDCAVNGNVSALRNPAGLKATLACSYGDPQRDPGLTTLTERALPLHRVIRVDGFLPGCPPLPEQIRCEIMRHIAG